MYVERGTGIEIFSKKWAKFPIPVTPHFRLVQNQYEIGRFSTECGAAWWQAQGAGSGTKDCIAHQVFPE
jgi:hypothetical protein